MADGRTHPPLNSRLLVASQNVDPEMKLGQEVLGTPVVNDARGNRNLSDLDVDLFLYGIGNASFGAGGHARTGRPSGILG